MHVVYCLRSANGRRSYVGVTNDLRRRLRQHRREIVGGARATRLVAGADWQLLYVVEGLPDRTTALQIEWRLHHPGRRAPPGLSALERRAHHLKTTLALDYVTSKARPTTEWIEHVTVAWQRDLWTPRVAAQWTMMDGAEDCPILYSVNQS